MSKVKGKGEYREVELFEEGLGGAESAKSGREAVGGSAATRGASGTVGGTAVTTPCSEGAAGTVKGKKKSRRGKRIVTLKQLEEEKCKPVKRGRKRVKPNKARDDFYADLEAQQLAKDAMNIIAGEIEMAEAEAMDAAKKIMPRTAADLEVVAEDEVVGGEGGKKGEDGSDLGDGIAEDETPEWVKAVMARRAALQKIKNTDMYQVYARINPRILKHFVSRAFIGYPACTILGQDEVIGLCCSMPPEDAIAPGFSLVCRSRDKKHKPGDEHVQQDADFLTDLQAYGMDKEIDKLCIKFGTYKRLYGIGIAIPIVRLKNGHTFDEEYDPELIEPGSFKGFNVVDPSKVAWDFDANTLYNPLSEWYQKPEYLRLVATMGTEDESLSGEQRMHRSWLITSNYREVGEDLLATYLYGGQPLSQILYERVFCANKLANEIVALAMSKRVFVMETNVKAALAKAKSTNNLLERLNYFRNNHSVLFKETGTGQVYNMETSLADLQPLCSQQFQLVASYSGIPITKLFKNVPSGLQATGQYQEEDYAQTIKPIRKDFEHLINRYYEMLLKSEYEDRDDLAVRCQFAPFIAPKAQEVQQIASGKMSMVCQGLQAGLVTITEGRAILKKGDDNGVFESIASETPELLKKIEAMKDPEKQQEMQMKMQQAQAGAQGGMPGAGGQPENPQFEQNKTVFQDALNEVLGGGGEGEGEGGEGEGEGEGGEQSKSGVEGEGGEESKAGVEGEGGEGEGE